LAAALAFWVCLLAARVGYAAPPVAVLTAPTPFAAIRGPTQFVASCTDDRGGPCASLSISIMLRPGYVGPSPLTLAGTGSVNQVVDLSPFDGFPVDVQLVATDSLNQTVTTDAATLYVDLSPDLVPVLTVNGFVLDFDATRVLALDPTSHDLILIDRTTNAITQVTSQPLSAALTPSGAIWTDQGTSGSDAVNVGELRNGQVSTVGAALTPSPAMAVLGAYAAWIDPSLGIVERDLTAGTSVTLVSFVWPGPLPLADTGEASRPEVYSDGTAVFAEYADSIPSASSIFQWKSGTTSTLLSFDQSVDRRLVTDGTHVAFTECFSPSPPSPCPSAFLSNGMAVALGDDENYALHAGYIAFERHDSSGVEQVWVRDPSGVETAVSIFGTSSSIDQPNGVSGVPALPWQLPRFGHDSVSDTGGVIFLNGATSTAVRRRYFGMAGAAPVDLCSSLGLIRWDNGFYVMMGGTVFSLTTPGTGGPDGGSPEGGSSDGGSPDGASPDGSSSDGASSDAGSDADSSSGSSSGSASSGSGSSSGTGAAPDASAGDAGHPSGAGVSSSGGCGIGTDPRANTSTADLAVLMACAAWIGRRRRATRPSTGSPAAR
jgi:hypothetical protein